MQHLTPIKVRKAKVSPRGIYIEDRELLETAFSIGSKFDVTCDPEMKIVGFILSDIGKHTVSKRKIKDVLRPVLDVVKQEVKDTIKGCIQLEIRIYHNIIIIEGTE